MAGLSSLGLTMQSPAADPPATAAQAQHATVSAKLSSLKTFYADLKFVLDLAGDSKSYDDLKDTLDLSLDGVDPGRPCEVRVFVAPEGLQTVAYLPAATVADYRKFVQALSDADVRTVSAIGEAPAAVRTNLKGVKLQPNERIIVSMYEGFLRFADGYIRFGHDLSAIRYPGPIVESQSPSETVVVSIGDDGSTPAERREAFTRSRQKTLSDLKKDKDSSDTVFALRKASLDLLFASLESVFADSSRSSLRWSMAQDTKNSVLRGECVPAPETPLADDIRRLGQHANTFGGISSEGAVASVTCNVPFQPGVGRTLKSAIAARRDLAHERIEHDAASPAEKAADRAFADMVFDVVDDVSNMDSCNAVLRSWSNGNGTLTTVCAVRVADGEKHRMSVQKIGSRLSGSAPGGNSEIAICKIPVFRWRKEFAELFDREGTVFVAVSNEAVWFGFGENAVTRLQQSIEQSKSAPGSDTAIEVRLDMHPLAEVWDRIHQRRTPTPVKKAVKKSGDKKVTEEKPSATLVRSIVTDLNLPKIAAAAYQTGASKISVDLKRDGDRAILQVDVDEATLRFIGQALSRFAKDNL